MRTVDFGAEQNTFEPEDGAGAKEYLDEDPAEILGVRQSENGPVESQKDAAVAAARSHEVGVLMLEDIHPPAAQAKQPERQQAIDAGESDDPKSSAAGASEGGEGGSGHPPENTTTFDDGESGREDGDDAEKVDRVESAADYPYLREYPDLLRRVFKKRRSPGMEHP